MDPVDPAPLLENSGGRRPTDILEVVRELSDENWWVVLFVIKLRRLFCHHPELIVRGSGT